MRTKVWIEQEIEVEVTAADAIAALSELPEPDRLPLALSAVSQCIGFLGRIPDEMIASMSIEQRAVITRFLDEQLARYRSNTVSKAPATSVADTLHSSAAT